MKLTITFPHGLKRLKFVCVVKETFPQQNKLLILKKLIVKLRLTNTLHVTYAITEWLIGMTRVEFFVCCKSRHSKKFLLFLVEFLTQFFLSFSITV